MSTNWHVIYHVSENFIIWSLAQTTKYSPVKEEKEIWQNAPGEYRKEAIIRPKKTSNFFMVHLSKTLENTGENVHEYF